MEEPWPGSQGTDISPNPQGCEGKSQITWVGATESLVEVAVLQEWLLSDSWGCLPVVLLSLGKLKVETPPEESAPGMSITWSLL